MDIMGILLIIFIYYVGLKALNIIFFSKIIKRLKVNHTKLWESYQTTEFRMKRYFGWVPAEKLKFLNNLRRLNDNEINNSISATLIISKVEMFSLIALGIFVMLYILWMIFFL